VPYIAQAALRHSLSRQGCQKLILADRRRLNGGLIHQIEKGERYLPTATPAARHFFYGEPLR